MVQKFQCNGLFQKLLTKIFVFHGRYVFHSEQNFRYDESENNLLSGHLTMCVVCVRKFMCLHEFLFTYVWM